MSGGVGEVTGAIPLPRPDLACGVLEKTDSGQVIFPYDELHVDFKLRAA